MNWSRNIFVKNAKLYELVLEGMWEQGERDALAISGVLHERGIEARRVLDVPCGIGRVAIPLAQLGFSMMGVDYSPHLVDVANAKARQYRVADRASFVRGEMSKLSSLFESASFDCAINVFTSLGYGSEDDDLQFLRELRTVVRRGGLFLISGLRNRDYIVRHQAQNVYEESDRLLVLDRYAFDVVRSRERGSWRFFLRMGSALKQVGDFPIDIRVYSPHEIASILDSSGWRLAYLGESLDSRRPFNPESPVYCLEAEAV